MAEDLALAELEESVEAAIARLSAEKVALLDVGRPRYHPALGPIS